MWRLKVIGRGDWRRERSPAPAPRAMRRVALAGVIAGWAVVAALAAPASADNGSTTASDGGSTVNVGASSSSAGTGPAPNPVVGQSGVSTSACHYTPLPAQDAAAFGAGGPAPGGWFFVSCPGRPTLTIFTGVLIWIPAGAPPPAAPASVSPIALATQARDSLTLPSPEIAFSPSPYAVVNIETWLWVANSMWRPFTASASAGGVTATASATPESVVWTTGDGARLVCDGPGVAYQPAVAPNAQTTYCGHVYLAPSVGQPSLSADPNGGAYPVTATVMWSVTWSSTGASGGGQLAPLFTSTTASLRVEQVESVGLEG
jgi:hypothetical protein